jgi:Holliday junction resolvasome RuvABC endonuclease subunit
MTLQDFHFIISHLLATMEKKSKIEDCVEPKLKRKQPEVVHSQVFVGIDPGFQNFGFVVATKTGNTLKIEHQEVCKVHDIKDSNPIHLLKSLEKWMDHLETLVENTDTIHFLIEQQYWSPRFAAVGLKLRTLQTALVATIMNRCKGDITLLPSSTVKKHFDIHTKDRAQNKVVMKKLLKDNFGVEESNEHLADCILLLLYFITKNE